MGVRCRVLPSAHVVLALPDSALDPLLELSGFLPPHDCGVEVCRRQVVGVCEHQDDAECDRGDRVDRKLPLASQLHRVEGVLPRWVQDRDADLRLQTGSYVAFMIGAGLSYK